MKKDYLKKRLIEWCHGHNCIFTLYHNGALLIHYKEHNSIYCDLIYPSLSYAYRRIIIDKDMCEMVDEYDDDGAKLPF